jgi:hypothetical protein
MSSTESLTKEVIEENIVKIQLKAVEKIEAQKDKFKNINSFVN